MYVNLDGVIRRVGIERVGFFTLTFPDHVTDYGESSARFHSLSANFLKPRGLEYISVPERQSSGRFHFHCATAFPWDIRTGFDFESCRLANELKRRCFSKVGMFNRNENGWGWSDPWSYYEFKKWERLYFQSANERLRDWWRDVDNVARGYGFGRCETLPILSNAQALARYVGAYVTTAVGARLACDKGMRTVRYALARVPVNLGTSSEPDWRTASLRTASCRWSWVGGNGQMWRRGLQLMGQILEIDYEEFKARTGPKGFYRHRDIIVTLGKNFEAALPFVAQIPPHADTALRCGFLARLVAHFSGGEISPSQILGEETETENCPF